MTPEQQAAEHPDLAERQTRMSQIINGAAEAPRTRKRRSDADKPREKAQAMGRITREQAAHIDKLRVEAENAETAHVKSAEFALLARRAYYDYLDEITAK